jgi:hypothetical protein
LLLTAFEVVLIIKSSWQVNLVDWLKMMVGNRRSEEVVDPNIEVRPSTRALKRALLTALRCVDPDSEKRPKMSQVVRMLESEEYPIPREVCFLFYFFIPKHILIDCQPKSFFE